MSDLINSVVKALDTLGTTSNNFTAALVPEPKQEQEPEQKQEQEIKDKE